MTGKRHITIRSVLFLLALILPASAQDRYLVRVHGSAAGNFARNHGLTLLSSPADPKYPKVGTLSPLGGSVQDLYLMTLSSVGSEDAIRSIGNDPAVQQVERDQRVALPKAASSTGAHSSVPKAQSASSLPAYALYYGSLTWSPYLNQPASDIVNIPRAHRISTGAGTVAFLDTGVDFTHPALASSLNMGWDFTNNVVGGAESPSLNQSTTSILDSDAMLVLNQSTTSILDQSTTSILDGTPVKNAYGHGTMIAGIIHLGAPTARLMPVKVFGNDGTSSLSLILSGLYWAVDHGAKVINMSFSMTDYSQEFANALNYANSKRVICVASVGNDGKQVTLFPAGYSHTMGIASTNNNDKRSAFSNYGDSVVTVAAPGEGIISAYPGNHYAAGWGTSFSAPFVSGAAALFVQLTGNIDESHAEKAAQQADDVGQGLGAGRLDLSQACSYQASR